jgi:hypothetical protein
VKKDHVLKAIHKASNETAHLMGAHVRSEARKSNWPENVSRSMSVTHTNGSFDAHVHDSHHTEALNHEYGTPSITTTAAVRRTANRTQEAEHFLVKRLFHHLEGSL